MAKVKGYYNVNNNVFLGMIQSGSGNTLAIRYIDGICFGEYDTETEEFVPHTNPMRIPKGEVLTFDENIETGKTNITGFEIENGADIARKKIFRGTSKFDTPNVVTSLDRKKMQIVNPKYFAENTFVREKEEPSKGLIGVREPIKVPKKIDWESLF